MTCTPHQILFRRTNPGGCDERVTWHVQQSIQGNLKARYRLEDLRVLGVQY